MGMYGSGCGLPAIAMPCTMMIFITAISTTRLKPRSIAAHPLDLVNHRSRSDLPLCDIMPSLAIRMDCATSMPTLGLGKLGCSLNLLIEIFEAGERRQARLRNLSLLHHVQLACFEFLVPCRQLLLSLGLQRCILRSFERLVCLVLSGFGFLSCCSRSFQRLCLSCICSSLLGLLSIGGGLLCCLY